MFEILNDIGQTFIDANTVHYSLLKKYSFVTLKRGNYHPSVDAGFIGSWNDLGRGVLVLANGYHRESIIIQVPRDNSSDLFAIQSNMPGIVISCAPQESSIIFQLFIPEDISDFLAALKSVNIYHFTMQIVRSGNVGLQLFDSSGNCVFFSGNGSLRILKHDPSFFSNLRFDSISHSIHHNFSREVAVIFFIGTNFLKLPLALMYYSLYLFRFPARGEVEFAASRVSGGAVSWNDPGQFPAHYGVSHNLAYMVIDVTGL